MTPAFTIPASIRSVDASLKGWPVQRVYCWECGSGRNVSGVGRLARCGGCRASELQQTREDADYDRRERDEEGS